jgi:hypothetical protein
MRAEFPSEKPDWHMSKLIRNIEENSSPERKFVMGKLVGINDLERGEDLTLQEAKEFECCKGLTDDEINELLEVLKIFSQVAYNLYAKQKLKEETVDESKQAA